MKLSLDIVRSRPNLRISVGIFGAVVLIYALVSGSHLSEPTPHFHFVDLAHSFLDGRLDTDTPRQRLVSPARASDPQGYRAAIGRIFPEPDLVKTGEKPAGGWNDWAYIEHVKLRDGSEHSGRYPWKRFNSRDKKQSRDTFWTTEHEVIPSLLNLDLARDCGEKGRSLCNERTYYVSFPPAPALVMMPFAALSGYDTNDVMVTLLFAGLNAVLLFLFLQLLVTRGHSVRSRRENVWLVALFAFGTVVFFSSIRGEVWFTALVFGVTFNLLYMLAALDLKHPVLAGLMLGLGLATRTPIAFCVVFFAWQLFFPGNRWEKDRWRAILAKGTLFAVPILAIGALLMAYNHARFGSAFEFGHSYLTGGAQRKIIANGLFSTHYLGNNLRYALVNTPVFNGTTPYIHLSGHGLGLLITTPALFLLARPKRFVSLGVVLWITVAAAAIPGLLYQNTGWEQFSYRFAMDYLPYLVALLAIGGRPFSRRVKGVFILCMVINLLGAVAFTHFRATFFG